ncbi:MAG: bifunctional hydroxymethylpyrimidine kinase/phosphomethylpyrimidine kinase [Deltaproteobacteria bacterium]|nr:bifunctional hydroxymethylpyrimidine kinase/phosphomethylpyrimidine kinase [Deltaproteobacteria bacterium]
MKGRVLVVAGSDSGGGAGLQADIKTITVLGGFAATAITALTAQNSLGVHGVMDVAPDFVARQMEVVLEDLGADCIKAGMLPNAGIMEAVARVLESLAPSMPLVLDPVMVAKGGAALMDPAAIAVLKEQLLPKARLLTPNLPEASALLGREIGTEDEMEDAARELLAMGPQAVLLKGGHLVGTQLVDVLCDKQGVRRFVSSRIDSRHTHGTGCTTASAIACGLAQGSSLDEAVERALRYVRQAILSAPGYGAGHGPLDHGHPLRDVDFSC